MLAGVSVFERQPHWLSTRLDQLASDLWPDSPESLEFRGADIFAGKKHWRGLPKDLRIDAYRTALGHLTKDRSTRLFGAAIHKAAVAPQDPMECAFETVSHRFDLYLRHLYRQAGAQRGLLILDKSTYETSLQGLARNFRIRDDRWRRLYNLADVPLFVDSRATRMVQYADLIAYALRRYFEKGDATLFDVIAHAFYAEGGVVNGLVHQISAHALCNCFCCRRQ